MIRRRKDEDKIDHVSEAEMTGNTIEHIETNMAIVGNPLFRGEVSDSAFGEFYEV